MTGCVCNGEKVIKQVERVERKKKRNEGMKEGLDGEVEKGNGGWKNGWR